MTHPLTDPTVVATVTAAASAHRGRPWTSTGFTDLNARAAHPAGIFHGKPFSVFAKLTTGARGRAQFEAEFASQNLIAARADLPVPIPLGTSPIPLGTAPIPAGSGPSPAETGPAPATDGASDGWLFLTEAVPGRSGRHRTRDDYVAIGRALAGLHQVHDERFGLADSNGFFGPLPQDNRPVATNRWTDFYARRRVEPMLRLAVDSRHLPAGLRAGIERILTRLPDLGGPEPAPSLLHGDAQQNNFICGQDGAVIIDSAAYFGHAEVDLALLDYFQPVPSAVFDGYREIGMIDRDFESRRELWRIFAYLAVISVVPDHDETGAEFRRRLVDAVRYLT